MYKVKISTKDVLPFLYCIFITTYVNVKPRALDN